MTTTPDPVHDALHDALLSTLLGSTTVPTTTTDSNGGNFYGTVTIPSAFEARIRQMAQNKDFDSLIEQAMTKITPDSLVDVIKETIGAQMLRGIESVAGSRYDSKPTPGWLQVHVRTLAVEALTTALSADEGLLDTLRARIGAEVDRNHVGITVSLSDPER